MCNFARCPIKRAKFQIIISAISVITLLNFQHSNILNAEIIQEQNIRNSSKVTYLSVEAFPYTGMGNCMFQYASFLGTAVKLNKTAVFTPNAYYPSKVIYQILKLFFLHFPLTYTTIVESPASLGNYFDTTVVKADLSATNWDSISMPNVFDPNIYQRFAPDKNYVIQGYLEAGGYFSHIRKRLIEKEFRFKPEIHQSGKERLNEIRKRYCPERKSCFIIGIHVRRREKVYLNNWNNYDCRFNSAETVYIRNAVRFYETRFGRKSILVFAVLGDDTEWNRRNIPPLTKNVVVIVQPRKAAEDMRLLSLCDHLIINVGTYGFWSGYLSKGLVVYPEHYGNAHYYPPEWIKLPRSTNNSASSCKSEARSPLEVIREYWS